MVNTRSVDGQGLLSSDTAMPLNTFRPQMARKRTQPPAGSGPPETSRKQAIRATHIDPFGR